MSSKTPQAHRRSAVLAASLGLLMLGAGAGHASSSDAWDEFRQDVEKACIAAAGETLEVKSVEVDPFGSESYGFAVLFGAEKGSTDQRLVVCAYNKQTQAAEISGPLGMPAAD